MWWIPFYKISQRGSSYSKVYDNVFNAELGAYAEIPVKYHQPRKFQERFEGMVFLLTSHKTFSAGVVFASTFQYNKMGTVVGQETGGRLDFLSDPLFLELPYSKLRAKIPVAALVFLGEDPDRGIIPDVKVEYAHEDYENERDKDLEAVKELIIADSKAISAPPNYSRAREDTR